MQGKRALTAATQKGTAAIEFSLVLVFLLLLTIGITEIGRAFWYYSAIQKATREGARCLSIQAWVTPIGTTCQNLVVNDANAASVRPALALANVAIDCGGGSCSWGGTTRPEYVRVRIVNYKMQWIWSLGGGLPALGAAAGSGLQVSTTMPYMDETP